MSATHLKEVKMEKLEKKAGLKRNSCRNILHIIILITCKNSRSSPICKLQIVEEFQNIVPQCRIVKVLNISSCTVRNIIRRFRESAEISVRKGQAQKSI